MESSTAKKKFKTKGSVHRARAQKSRTTNWSIKVGSRNYAWTNRMARVDIIRQRLPYGAVEVMSKSLNMPVKQLLGVLGLPQTTYNEKKKKNDLLNGRDSEVIVVLTELLDFGLGVFNDEKDKFLRWLKKPNVSLGGISPESLFDSLTGIQEVKNSLNRIEYGNMA